MYQNLEMYSTHRHWIFLKINQNQIGPFIPLNIFLRNCTKIRFHSIPYYTILDKDKRIDSQRVGLVIPVRWNRVE